MKINNLKLILIIFLFAIFPVKNAYAWNSFAAEAYGVTLLTIRKIMDGTMLGSLKQQMAEQAIQSVGQQTEAQVISDPYLFIFTNSQDSAYASTTDFLTHMAGGRTADYTPSSREGVAGKNLSWGGNGNYLNYLVTHGKNSIKGTTPQSDIQNYVSDPSRMFSTGNWRAFNSFISNSANNPLGVSLLAEKKYLSDVSKMTEINKSLFNSGQGFAPITSKGKIITPGSIIKDMQSDTNNIGNEILVNATYQQELIEGLINRFVGKTMGGIGDVKKTLNQIDSVQKNYSEAAKRLQTTDPLSKFKPSY